MQNSKHLLEKSKEVLRKQIKAKLISRIAGISGSGFGEAIYCRPFKTDEKIIEEIAEATDEKKSAIAQKLLHLVLSAAPNESARENRQLELIGWLVTNEKHKSAERDVQTARLERLEAHAGEMEILLQKAEENSRFTKILTSEIYCIANVCMSYLNQIFTKLIEYFSPVEIEKKNSSDFANRNILGLVEHSLSELEKITEHHDFDALSVELETLYLFTKIEKIRARLLPSAIQS
ncbi:MAG TPA: hypothetical protein VK308_06760, partial [Pyrinomonadaceae bacterium]|nr:hypothetical protein [Pyrinomonadaceae bacterium]